MTKKAIPICPIMTQQGDMTPTVCMQEYCAWYVASLKTCGVYALAHNALLEIKAKQAPK